MPLTLPQMIDNIVATHEPQYRERLRAALYVGARLAFMRLREISGNYIGPDDCQKADAELNGGATALNVIEPPAPVADDSTL